MAALQHGNVSQEKLSKASVVQPGSRSASYANFGRFKLSTTQLASPEVRDALARLQAAPNIGAIVDFLKPAQLPEVQRAATARLTVLASSEVHTALERTGHRAAMIKAGLTESLTSLLAPTNAAAIQEEAANAIAMIMQPDTIQAFLAQQQLADRLIANLGSGIPAVQQSAAQALATMCKQASGRGITAWEGQFNLLTTTSALHHLADMQAGSSADSQIWLAAADAAQQLFNLLVLGSDKL